VEAEPVSHAYYLEHGAWLRAMVLLAVGDAPAALRVLDPAITEAELQGKKGKLTALFACRAAALHQLGRNDPASLALRTALDYAREQGAFQSIAGLTGPLRDLLLSELRACAGQNDPARTALIRRLLGAASPAGSSPSTPVTQEWEEPLSEREIEVLSCMALGLSNSQIAARLVVAPNTIKKHVGNIFAKLNVTSRIAAVEKGRHKNLIP
jgi:LuxR family maltose regulon positive regulatory protein